jgi:hypothetical protein
LEIARGLWEETHPKLAPVEQKSEIVSNTEPMPQTDGGHDKAGTATVAETIHGRPPKGGL